MFRQCVLLIGMMLAAVPALAGQEAPEAVPSIEDHTSGMQKIDGYFPIYWEEATGSMFLEVPRLETDFLMVYGLSAGLGSNDIGLDRGGGRDSRIVQFQRIGPSLLLIEPNTSFRSSSPNPLEVKAVEDSFARSVIWGFTVAAETGDRLLVDATDFLIRDLIDAADDLKPGNYGVERSRSAIFMPNTRNFPENTEIDVLLTFVNRAESDSGGGGGGPAQGPPRIGTTGGGGGGGGLFSGSISSVAPTADSVTMREHVSLVQLPDDNYEPRASDPRSGFGGLTYVDFSVPMSEPLVQRFIRRHRLVKKDPSAAMSDPVEPIRYYVDSGAPEDVRQALIDGARWWNDAFETAGFTNAFIVDVLPEGADPMDIRYNVVNWVHRSTRGWSSGGSVTDPRTGEIIKATVTLDSQRSRQDLLIFEGLLSPYEEGTEEPTVAYQTALARIRQLSAHEVGHTLGIGHQYYNSSQGRISVMDYPRALETLNADGTIGLSDAYEQEIGEWDRVAINYGYRQFPEGTDEKAALTQIINDAWAEDLIYLTNQDMDVNPKSDQWLNGVDPADELTRQMGIRRAALDSMGEATVPAGEPITTVEEPLVPIFMYHRFAVEATASMVGGQNYIYAIRGDGRTPMEWVSAAQQEKALEALASTLQPSELTVPAQILALMPPRPPGYGETRELFPGTTGDAFDPLSPGTIAADVTIGFVLQLDRAARMVAQHALDPSLPGLSQVLDRLTEAVFDAPTASPYEAAIRRAEERVLVDRVTWLASGSRNSQVRAIASLELQQLAERLRGEIAEEADADLAQHTLLAADIKRFLERPAETATMRHAADAPPGAPIGDVGQDWLATPPLCGWNDGSSSTWLFHMPPQ